MRAAAAAGRGDGGERPRPGRSALRIGGRAHLCGPLATPAPGPALVSLRGTKLELTARKVSRVGHTPSGLGFRFSFTLNHTPLQPRALPLVL